MIFDTNKNTNNNRRKGKNWMERVRTTKPIGQLLLLRLGEEYGMIWNWEE